MSETKLLSCPFCGGEAVLCNSGNYSETTFYWIYCKECGCKQPSSIHRESVIKAWNDRKPVEDALERLEEEYKAADDDMKRCSRENPLQFDSAKGYARGMSDAIEIIKEELM